MGPTFLAGLLMAAAGPAPGAAVDAAVNAAADAGDAPTVSAAMDTIRVVAAAPAGDAADPDARPDAPRGAETPRDPRTEPLFVNYARPVQLMGLADRLDLDRVRWRYAPPAGGD